MNYELALGRINEYIGWCERSLWLRMNDPGSPLREELQGNITEGLPLVELIGGRLYLVAFGWPWPELIRSHRLCLM